MLCSTWRPVEKIYIHQFSTYPIWTHCVDAVAQQPIHTASGVGDTLLFRNNALRKHLANNLNFFTSWVIVLDISLSNVYLVVFFG